MSRLTGRTAKGIANLAISKTLPERDQEIEGCNIVLDAIGDVFQKLAEYEDLEEQGRLIKLPCKVGDTVWKIKATFSYFTKPMEDRVDRIIITRSENLVCCTSGTKFGVDKMGVLVFLTRTEAEAKLKELKECERYDNRKEIYASSAEKVEANRLIEQAAEKQVEKKITADGRCPCCGNQYCCEYILDYCYICGQKIDWSDI